MYGAIEIFDLIQQIQRILSPCSRIQIVARAFRSQFETPFHFAFYFPLTTNSARLAQLDDCWPSCRTIIGRCSPSTSRATADCCARDGSFVRFTLAGSNERFSPRFHVLFCDYCLKCSDLSARTLSCFPASFFIFTLHFCCCCCAGAC